MIDSVTILNETGERVKINIILRFRIEELERDYVVYTLNDDGKSDPALVLIAGIEEKGGELKLRLIPEDEKRVVLVFYDNVRDTIIGKR